MKRLLQRDYRLCGWKGDPFNLVCRTDGRVTRLSPAEFAYLLRCDGQTEIEPDAWPPEPEWALREKVIADAAPGETLLPEQEYRLFPNRKASYVDMCVTGRCNLNCKHCFNAKDCNPRSVEPPLEQLLSLLDRMADCGFCRIRLNGGEPLVRRDILTVTGEMAKRGMAITEFLTNGVLITPKLLDTLEAQGHRPVWFISFDGLGCHDWLRGVPGTEEKVLKNIQLLCDRGYYVQIHQSVWKDSLSSIRPTVLRMKEMGVSRYRILPVEPSVRWVALARDQSVTNAEWLDYLPGFLDWWYENNIDLDLEVWSYWVGNKGSRRVIIEPDLLSQGLDNRSRGCMAHIHRVFIDADGRLLRCMPLSGIMAAYGFKSPNLYQGDDLQQILTESDFMDQMACSCGEMKARLPECQACAYSERCSMGCRAEAMAQGNGPMGIDNRVCEFFKNGYYEKMKAVAEKHGLKYTV